MIATYLGKPVTPTTINNFSLSELIILLSCKPFELHKDYDLETLTREELLNLVKRYVL